MSITFHVDKLPTVRHSSGTKEALEKISLEHGLNISESVRLAITEVSKEFGYNQAVANASEALEYLKSCSNTVHPAFKCGLTNSVLIRNCLTYYASKL